MRSALLPLLLLGFSPPALAQEPGLASPIRAAAPAASLRASAGLAEEGGGRYLAGGTDYRAHLDGAGLTFQPALGSGVAETQFLGLSLRGVERGGEAVLAQPLPGTPRLVGDGLEVVRGDNVVERYDVRSEGVELSYRFDRPLAGAGDLVVRLGLATSLPLPGNGEAHSLDFVLPGQGGVTIGAVQGVDAAGRTAAGSLRLAGDELALVLPSAFVAEATYPLWLDPLVGSAFLVSGSGNDDLHPDAAFDSSNNVYLAVWERVFSASDSDIRGQRISGSGALVGSTIFFGSAHIAHSPAVANLAARNRFAVTWIEDNPTIVGTYSNLMVQFADAATGSLGATSMPASVLNGDLLDPDVCGEGIEQDTGAGVDLVIVYNDEYHDEIRLVHGAFNLFDMLAWETPKTVFKDESLLASYSEPTIARSSGVYGRAVVAVRRGAFLSNATIRGTVVHVDGTGIGASFAISSTASSASAPDLDGFDRIWMASWVAEDTDGFASIQAASLKLVEGSLDLAVAGPPVDVAPGSSFFEMSRPAVGFSQGKSWIGWRSTTFGGSNLQLKGYDSYSCIACEGSLFLDGGTPDDMWVAIATPTSGGAYYDDRGLATWSVEGLGGDIQAQLLQNNQQLGTTQNIGGGCGTGGTVQFSAPASVGSSWWYSSVVGLPANAVATFVNFSFQDPSTSIACGACQWMPFQIAFSPPMQFDPLQGKVASGVAIIPCNPALVGAKFTVQWTTVTPSSSPCSLFPSMSISDRHRVTIGQ